jgi:NADPH:quinone reductase-like Zn-dependent oxidoreductase
MKMKAVICPAYGPPEVLQFAQIKKPVPGPNEVLIKVRATTVTVADQRVRSFNVPKGFDLPARLALGITKPRKPVLGAELAGDIVAVGERVTRFKVGDAVFASIQANFGAYAEYACLPEHWSLALKPQNLRYEEAAAIPVGALTAMHYLKSAHLKKGQKLLVYGASGSVGTYAVQLAKHFGTIVTAVCSQPNHDWIQKLGADQVLDYQSEDFTDRLERYDAVLVAIDKLPFAICNRILKPNGIYLNVTRPFKTFEMIKVGLTSAKTIMVGESPREKAQDLETLKKLAEQGVLKPVMDKVYPMHEIVEAHRYVDLGHKKGNVAITME